MTKHYDFETVIDRRNTYSAKWDVPKDALSMSIADMDFKTAPEITSALIQRAQEGIYGYSDVSLDWKKAIIHWWKEKHHFTIKPEWLLFSTGVVPTISSLVRRFSHPGENILVLTPVYNIFFHSIENNGRKVLESKLMYKDHSYSIDFEDFEKKLQTPNTPMFILCNPQNPTGKIWSREELTKIGQLCAKYHTLVLSDEIHCDITRIGKEYTPFASISKLHQDHSITAISPTKTFNMAGLQTSAIVVSNPALREEVYRSINNDEIAEPNFFAQTAVIAAFTKGEEWLNALKQQLDQNIQTVCDFIQTNKLPISVIKPEATYLIWLDVSSITQDSTFLNSYLIEKEHLYLNEGEEYRGDGKKFLRLNVACPQRTLLEGLSRLKEGILSYLSEKKKPL